MLVEFPDLRFLARQVKDALSASRCELIAGERC
jgi:hypothetical protein